jgi:hypothetical protein
MSYNFRATDIADSSLSGYLCAFLYLTVEDKKDYASR